MPDAKGNLSAAEQAELANFAIALGHSPKSRKALAKLVRDHADDPRVAKFVPSFADVKDEPDADPAKKPLTRGDLDERLAEDEGKRRASAAERERVGQRQKLVESGRFTEDSMKGLDKFMEDHGYTNYDHAAVIYAHENPPANPRPTIGSSKLWEMPGDKDWRNNPKKTALNEAYKVVDELRGTRRV